MKQSATRKPRLTIVELLRPHKGALALGLLAIMGESAANLLGPWPLKIVLDSVLRTKPTHGWLSALITRTVGTEKIAMLDRDAEGTVEHPISPNTALLFR